MANLKDVAREAGVSVTAVSYALKDSPKISQETKDRINEVAKRLNYRPSALARSLKSQKTWNIGVFLHGYSGPVYGEVLQSIHDVISSKGYEIMVCSTRLSDRLLVERHMDGAILLNSFISDKTLKLVQSDTFPLVVMDRVLEMPYVTSVVTDNIGGGYLAVKHLLESGRKKLAYMSGSKDSYENTERTEGVKKALTEANVNFSDIPVIYGGFEEESGRLSMRTLLSAYPDIDGIFCANDEMAIGAIRAIKELGRKVPEDIAVVGYDDIPLSSHYFPSLTTIRVDRRLWGYQAASSLLNLIDKKESKGTVVVPVKIIKRETVNKVEIGIGN